MAVISPVDLPEQLGRYRIVKKLGQGGMGAVYLAQDTELDRQVALKIPRIAAQDGSGVLDRFYREARAAATLRHPNICPVFDIGEFQGTPYLTMAFIEGKSLADFARAKPLNQRQAATVVRKLALALQEAHQRGVIHRDLKPANVMIDMRGEPIVMDFGLARRTSQNDTRLTRDGSAIGTPAYMPPEQISTTTENMGPRCDIYSLGVILYELLTGRLPFSGDAMAMLAQILTDTPPRPTSLQPDIDPALEAICLKAMAKKPEDRYASMAELAAELLEFLRGKTPAPQPAPTPKPQAVQTQPGFNVSMLGGLRSMAQAGQDLDLPKDTRAFQKKRKRSGTRQRRGLPPWAWAAIGGGALVILIAGILIAWSGKEPTPEGTPPKPNSNALASRNPPSEKAAKQSPTPSPTDVEEVPPKPVVPVVPKEAKQSNKTEPSLPSKPELARLDELNTPRWDFAPWLSPDGLTIYWEAADAGKRWIWMASRGSPNSAFEKKTRLLLGRHPTVTPDGLQVIFTDPTGGDEQRYRLYVATRSSRSQPFGTPQEIAELRPATATEWRYMPALSPDGLTICFMSADHGLDQFWYATRATLSSKWDAPQRLAMDLGRLPDRIISWPFLTSDQRTLYCVHEGEIGQGRFMVWTRSSPSAPFADFRYLEVPNVPDLYGRPARYVEATNELFFSSPRPRPIKDADWDLWVIRNFKPVDEAISAQKPASSEPASPASPDAGWASLFNGKDLSGWRQVGGGAGWWVKDGELYTDRGQPGARGLHESGWLMTERNYFDFILRLEFNVAKLADTGVAFRCDPAVAYPLGQAEIQIVDEQDPERARLLDEEPHRRTGALCPLASDRTVPSLERDRWHTMTVELRGRRLKVTVNDTVTVDTDLDRHVVAARKGQYGRAGVWRQSGPIALQKMLTPTGVARFRHIMIKDLSNATSAGTETGPSRTPVAPKPELVALRELPAGQNKSGPWLSADGRAIYWAEKQGGVHNIWRADRKGPGQPFEGAAKLFGGHDMTLSADMIEIVLVDYDPQPVAGRKFALVSARKSAPSDRFPLPRKMPEMAGLLLFAPCLSADGLTLYAEDFGQSPPVNVRFRRASRNAPWGKPEAVPLSGLKGGLRFPFISPDNRYLFGNNDESPSGMVVLTSSDGGQTFGSPRPIEVPGGVVKGKFPRYSPTAKELFFAESTTAQTAELYMIRNFDPASP